MRSRRALLALTAAAALAAWGPPARAVIRVDITVSKIYDSSKAVVVGTVTAVNPDNRVVDLKVTGAAKGDSPGEKVRVQIVSPEDVLKKAAAGQPAVLFVAEEKGASMALVHLADTWLMAQAVPESKPPVWRVVQVYDGKQTFPGRTAAVVRLAAELKAGKPSLLNKVEPNFFNGGVRQLAKLGLAKPVFLAAGDVNADRKPDLVVAAAGGTHLLLAAGAGYEDATAKWGLGGASGRAAAFGDVNGDGKPDLLIGQEIYINNGQKFAPAGAQLQLPDGARPLAAALADATGDGKPDAIVLLADGRVLVFKNPGAPDKPWSQQAPRTMWQEKEAALAGAIGDFGDNGKPHVLAVRPSGIVRYALDADGGPPADFERLTGEKPPHAATPEGLKNVVAAALDYNGDRRPDFLLVTDGGSLLLVNRGFGTFLAAGDAGAALISTAERPVSFKLSRATPIVGADMHGDGIDDLLVLTEDGRLFEADNHAKAAP